MARYIGLRLLHAAFVLAGVSVLVFFLVRLGGDPTALFLPPESTAEEIARFRAAAGFDQPLWRQYARFALAALQGDFGRSLRYDEPAMALVLERLPATLELGAAALALSVFAGVPLGILAAVRRGTATDQSCLMASLVGQSFPGFWLGIMMILVLSQTLRWLPASGRGTWQHLVMPAISLAATSTAIIMRLLRSNMIEALSADYVRTARGKGLGETLVVWRHALRNAAIPTLTVIALQVGALLGGAVITEQIFAWPGMGRLAIQAIANRDFAIVQAFVLFMAAVVVAINLAVDITYGLLDPRLRG